MTRYRKKPVVVEAQVIANRLLARTIPGKDPNECWAWRGHVNRKSGAKLYVNGLRLRTSRLSYVLFRGEIPDGMCVLHSCDRPECTNPAHLFLGSVEENNADRDEKGRGVYLRGAEHQNSKLTEADVLEILRLRSTGASLSEIARLFPVSKGCIGRIAKNQAWTHIPRATYEAVE